MNTTRDKLREARAKLSPLIEKRGPTSEAELDECVQALEELRQACDVASYAATFPPDEIVGFLVVMKSSLGVVAERIKNRPKGPGASKP